ncbi:hypothetical protein KK137_00340 [Croceibacterium sp. LX-88]|uniref:Uncharacterized protein n=1 Tax=Croceibacterium selenioxidans TaxID=2838833 RepID=A0ABS5VZ16_9SPHN|nr:hypothetical protein [Croceibacterium selenioxidans]
MTSSGHASLDKAACHGFQGVRYDPARDEQGNAVPGTFRTAWVWSLKR